MFVSGAPQGRFLKFDLRNGALRKKYDALKYTLKKMEVGDGEMDQGIDGRDAPLRVGTGSRI